MNSKQIACPGCKKPTVYSEDNKFRPFCSQLCSIEDTAAWATEEYRVPSREPVSEGDFEDEDIFPEGFGKA